MVLWKLRLSVIARALWYPVIRRWLFHCFIHPAFVRTLCTHFTRRITRSLGRCKNLNAGLYLLSCTLRLLLINFRPSHLTVNSPSLLVAVPLASHLRLYQSMANESRNTIQSVQQITSIKPIQLISEFQWISWTELNHILGLVARTGLHKISCTNFLNNICSVFSLILFCTVDQKQKECQMQW